MYFILFYTTTENYVEKRKPFRKLHLSHAKSATERGELILGGALAEPADEAVLVFKAEDISVAENFAKNDPYVKNGLIASWKVRPWSVVIGDAYEK